MSNRNHLRGDLSDHTLVAPIGGCSLVIFNSSALMDFHRKWGHLNFDLCLKILEMESGPLLVCPECELSKSKRKRIPVVSVTRSDQPLYRIHMDLSGRKLSSLKGERYYLLITDDYSRYRWVYFFKTKDETLIACKSFLNRVERESYPCRVSHLRSDGGGEFTSKDFKNWMESTGIQPETSAPYSQFGNGVSERGIGVIDDSARAMMLVSGSSSFDWTYAISEAVYSRNRSPSNAIDGHSPYELYYGIKREMEKDGPIFGCLGYAKIYIRGKQEPKARRVVFLCHSETYKAHLVRDISTFTSSVKEYYCRDVVYDVRVFPYRSRLVPRPVVPPLDEQDVEEQEKREKLASKADAEAEVVVNDAEITKEGKEAWEVDSIIGERKARGATKGLKWPDCMEYLVVWKPVGEHKDTWEPYQNLIDCDEAIAKYKAYHSGSGKLGERPPKFKEEKVLDELDEKHVEGVEPRRRSARLKNIEEKKVLLLYPPDPVSRHAAMSSMQKEEWLLAEEDELRSIQERKVWTLVPRTPGMHVLGCRFVYKTKRNPDGSIERFKARLVAQGYGQKKGIDFNEVFASTVAMQSLYVLLYVFVFYKMPYVKLDIKTFFLYGDLKETIYMKQPPGYESDPNMVCLLDKALYGLKQAMRCANEDLTKKLKLLGLQPLMTDQNVFYRRNSEGILLMCCWSDDLIVGASKIVLLDEFCDKIAKHYEVTIDRNPTHFLKLQVERDLENKTLKLHQYEYVRQLLKSLGMENANPVKVPFSTCDLPHPKEVECDKSIPYMEIVGSLNWLVKTRHDLHFYVSVLCRYMSRYDQRVYEYAKKVLKYLVGTQKYGLVFDESASSDYEYGKGINISFQVDSDWGGRIQDSRSTTGWLVRFNNSTVYSGCKFQQRIATNTCEAETNGLELVCKEVEWYRDFLTEIDIELGGPLPVWQDNNGALSLTKDPVMRPRTKYFRIPQAYIRSMQINEKAVFGKMKSADMAADMLNKCLTFPTFAKHRRFLLGDQNILPITTNTDTIPQAPDPIMVVTRTGSVNYRSSLSNDVPPMFCKCYECHTYCTWNERKEDWIQNCNCEFVTVICSKCNSVCLYNSIINKWYCSDWDCLEKYGDVSRRVSFEC